MQAIRTSHAGVQYAAIRIKRRGGAAEYGEASVPMFRVLIVRSAVDDLAPSPCSSDYALSLALQIRFAHSPRAQLSPLCIPQSCNSARTSYDAIYMQLLLYTRCDMTGLVHEPAPKILTQAQGGHSVARMTCEALTPRIITG
jgi:hypothetical protein